MHLSPMNPGNLTDTRNSYLGAVTTAFAKTVGYMSLHRKRQLCNRTVGARLFVLKSPSGWLGWPGGLLLRKVRKAT